MNIGSICNRRLVNVDRQCTLARATALMRENHVEALVVTTGSVEGARVTGIVTDRDLVVHVMALRLDEDEVTVGDMVHHRLVSVPEDGDLTEALDAMQESGVRCLLVADADQKLVGVLSLDDVMDACASLMHGLGRVIRSGIDREGIETSAVQLPGPLLHVKAAAQVA
jgi:CBS domain-containing protein